MYFQLYYFKNSKMTSLAERKAIIKQEGGRLLQKDMKELLQMALYSGIPQSQCVKQHSDGTSIMLDNLPESVIEQMCHFVMNKVGYNDRKSLIVTKSKSKEKNSQIKNSRKSKSTKSTKLAKSQSKESNKKS